MTGALPGTEPWCKQFPETELDDLDTVWRKFRAHHLASEERARLLRGVVSNELAELYNRGAVIPISMRRPEIVLSCCTGTSMSGFGIRYMDIVAIYPVSGSVEVEFLGEAELDNEGNKIYADFEIGIGDGISISPGAAAQLKFNEFMLKAAKECCPEELRSWANEMRKIRRIDAVKVTPSGTELISVSVIEDEPRKGDDHPVQNVSGSVFTCYSRLQYEARLKQIGLWGSLSLQSRCPELLRPEVRWDELFSDLSSDDRSTVEAFLLDGSGDLKLSENLQSYLTNKHSLVSVNFGSKYKHNTPEVA